MDEALFEENEAVEGTAGIEVEVGMKIPEFLELLEPEATWCGG